MRSCGASNSMMRRARTRSGPSAVVSETSSIASRRTAPARATRSCADSTRCDRFSRGSIRPRRSTRARGAASRRLTRRVRRASFGSGSRESHRSLKHRQSVGRLSPPPLKTEGPLRVRPVATHSRKSIASFSLGFSSGDFPHTMTAIVATGPKQRCHRPRSTKHIIAILKNQKWNGRTTKNSYGCHSVSR